jgi:hypothetical protein
VDEPPIRSRILAPGEMLVVASQACDIRHDREAMVEALVCHADSVGAKSVMRNSARKFVIDSARGVIASAQERLLIDKRCLLSASPQNVMAFQKLDDYTRWLARRFDRPALPDLLVKLFQTPLANAVVRTCRANAGWAEVLSRAVREVRANVPVAETPPFNMHVLLLIPEALSERELEIIDLIRGEMLATFSDNADVHLNGVELVLEDELSVADYFATRPLWFDDFTFEGSEVHGAEPFHSV